MKKIILLLCLLLAPALSYAQTVCGPDYFDNQPGDIIHIHLAFYPSNDPSNFHFQIYPNGGEQVISESGGDSCWHGDSCDLYYFFVATAFSENARVDVVSGSFHGWRCVMTHSVESHVRGTPIPQAAKDAAQRSKNDVDYWNGKLTYAGPLLCAVWDPMCIVVPAMAIGMQYHSDRMAGLIADPPTDCYASNNLSFPDTGNLGVNQNIPDLFGDGVVSGYTWGALYWTTLMDGYGRYAYDEANSASACAQIGDNGTYDWRIGNLKWAVANYAQIAANLAVHFRVLSNEFAAYWDPALEFSYPCDAANWQYYAERPDVEQNDYYGPGGPFGTNGALQHYWDFGYNEGMVYHVEFCPASLTLSGVLGAAANSLDVAAQGLPF